MKDREIALNRSLTLENIGSVFPSWHLQHLIPTAMEALVQGVVAARQRLGDSRFVIVMYRFENDCDGGIGGDSVEFLDGFDDVESALARVQALASVLFDKLRGKEAQGWDVDQAVTVHPGKELQGNPVASRSEVSFVLRNPPYDRITCVFSVLEVERAPAIDEPLMRYYGHDTEVVSFFIRGWRG
jgi:hypothetical protein